MPGLNRPASALLMAASAAIPVLAALLVFQRPASTLTDAETLARLGTMLARSARASSERPVLDSLTAWAGFHLPADAFLAPGTSGASSGVFPFRMTAFAFPADSSVMVLVSSTVPFDLPAPGPEGPMLSALGDRAVVIVAPGSGGSEASRAAGSLELL